MNTLIIWAFLLGLTGHGTQGAATSVTVTTMVDAQACEAEAKQINAGTFQPVGNNPMGIYKLVARCEHGTLPITKK